MHRQRVRWPPATKLTTPQTSVHSSPPSSHYGSAGLKPPASSQAMEVPPVPGSFQAHLPLLEFLIPRRMQLSTYPCHLSGPSPRKRLPSHATRPVLPTYRVSLSKEVFRRAGTKNIEKPNIIHWCGERLFLTLENYKNMLAAGKERGGDK